MKHTALRPKRLPLVAAIAAIGMMGSIPAHAVQFDVTDEVTGSFDTTLTYGALWRVTGQDKRLLLPANGGVRNSGNYDNGNANYERGDLVSSLFKMNNDIALNYKNFDAFFRVLSFYDHAIQNKDFDPNRADQRTIRNRLGHDYEIYDAYVRGNFDIGERNLGVRVGKQVISWGESTFIPNGINTLNPVDVAKLRAPGSELKEAFLPIGMAQMTLDITDNLSVELVSQYQWRATRIEPNGSYFSTNDFASPGGSKVLIASAAANENSPGYIDINEINPALAPGLYTPSNGGGVFIPRASDKSPSDSGQYGFAARLLVPELNNTEFGIYFANYHSRTPLISGNISNQSPTDEALQVGSIVAATASNLMPVDAATATNLVRAQNSRYVVEYPEDITMYGLSFNTLAPMGIALQGEYSYRPNQPLQLAANNLLAELLTFGAPPLNTGIDGLSETDPTVRGRFVEGYKRVKAHQFQMTATQTFGPQLGASQLIGVAEVGYAYLDLPSGIDFNGTGLDYTTNITNKGIMTRNSYGYRAVMRANYNNAFRSVNIIPRIAFSHDLRGTSPTFTQGNKAVSIGIGAEYLSSWQADISYTNFFGGEQITQANSGNAALVQPVSQSTTQALGDRDFIAASVSYSF
ncbi:uncharacterized protein DUF1302 [Paraperlucidibaca baekdonensis]|uniref:Uncharacterized protein DUF1302 n=1 Tax=Paraperlucidibaca baekdonensis TaxID=748120 RepID=A0A3E0H335_9GAMM|nr:DUF1302 domain-containing protein [Paraperlucidibaca baekdonensis]REH37565.1 uncharacterized protein DUF1302 [Paraperlucidibaca baekdonensis]